jgi:biopolymer transport protein ExbD
MLVSTQEGEDQLRRRFLYGCVAAALSINIFVFIANRRHTPKGYMVRVAPDTCLCATHDYRIIQVHLSKDGGVTINTEVVQANELRTLLSKIYAVRAERVIYLSSDLDVPFQRLAEVIDLLQNLQYSTSVLEPPALKDVRPMRVEVRLITTGSVDTRCPTGCVNWVRQPEALLQRRELVRSTAAPIARLPSLTPALVLVVALRLR